MTELERVVAYAFRLVGKDAMGRNEFKQLLSFRLNWYPPAQAAQVLDRAAEAGLVAVEGETVRAAFDLEEVALPLNFRGSAAALQEPLVPRAPGGPAPREALPDPGLEERARAWQRLAEGRLRPEVARLLARRERGADVREEAAHLLATLARGSR